MAQRTCPSCQFQNREGVKFCTQCGTQLHLESSNGPCLVMLYGEGQELIFPLKQHRTTIGRDLDNDIVLRDIKISKKHAAVVVEGDTFWIEDLNSKNGVFVNGRKIENKKRLFNGNLIKMGFTIFKFENLKMHPN
ncbi:MAG: FHA domain-containing protein [Calditrichaeota bacterium]|nr:MAG: FHA domain-containing protein [Calditrichota bacterium]